MSDLGSSELGRGTTISSYRVEALIGRGGMGAVYRASEEGLGRKVALKVIAPELAQDERFRERFLGESRIAASLDHPHVVPIYQAGEEDGLVFLAMRYVEGTDLAQLLASEGALEPRRALALLSQVAEALDAAHGKGLVHRDVKPSNVLIAEGAGSEHCYLADFGLTRQTGSASGTSAAGEVVGTLEYLAPEQITGDALDERSDVYSLGCVLYECLTGQAPFPRATDVALLWAHVHEEPTPPSSLHPKLPKELDAVLARALAKQPEHRYRSAGELMDAALGSTEGALLEREEPSRLRVPRPASSLVGRTHELSEILGRLAGGARLLTLTGAGGSGKTRLAIEVAASISSSKDGVFWVALASLRDPGLVSPTIAQALSVRGDLAEHVADSEMLVVLDNFEQVIDAAPELPSLLERCPNLTLLVTSRELLRVQGEIEYPVPPLSGDEAVALFCERAQTEASEEIAELCIRLDNLPLAVELAAARTKALSPPQILDRLSERLDLLEGGRDADPRQHTLRATIEWSYDLLAHAEQDLFGRLSVFVGGCTLEAAEEVAAADLNTLQSLVEKNLLRFSNERYWMLETIREFGLERLEYMSGADGLRLRHAEYFGELAERAELELEGPNQPVWLDTLAPELDNIRDALEWSLSGGRPELGARLASSLDRFWRVRGHPVESKRWLERALATNAELPPRLELKLLKAAGGAANDLRDHARLRELTSRRLELARELDDKREVARCLNDLGSVATMEGEKQQAKSFYRESLSLTRELGERVDLILGNLAYIALEDGELEKAEGIASETLAIAREYGDLERMAAMVRVIGVVRILQGRTTEALERERELVKLAGRLQAKNLFRFCCQDLALIHTRQGNLELGAELLGKAQALRDELGRERVEDVSSSRDSVLAGLVAQLRSSLTDDEWAQAMEIGREADLNALLEDALHDAERAVSGTRDEAAT